MCQVEVGEVRLHLVAAVEAWLRVVVGEAVAGLDTCLAG